MASPDIPTVPIPVSSDPIPLTAFTTHDDPDLYRMLMGMSLGFNVSIEQMDDLTPSGHVQIRIHAIGPTPADAQARVAALADVLANPLIVDDVSAMAVMLQEHMESSPTEIAAASQARHRASAAAADPRTQEPPRT